MFRVVPEDGSLTNTDGLFDIDMDGAAAFLEKGKTFQGGNWNHLQAMLDIEAGEEILYVGDHLYADVLRSKRALGWRSCFVMPELPEEMRVFQQQLELRRSIVELRTLRDELNARADALSSQWSLPLPWLREAAAVASLPSRRSARMASSCSVLAVTPTVSQPSG